MRGLLLVLFGNLLLACADKPPVPCGFSVPDQQLYVGEVGSISPCFEAEALPLALRAESTDPAVVAVAVAGGVVTFTGKGVGDVSVAITATDPNGLTGRQFLRIIVPNRPPRIVKEPLLESALWSITRVPLTDYIDDPDGQLLRYRIALDDQAAIQPELRGDTLILAPLLREEVVFTISATDPGQEEVRSVGKIHVGDPVAYVTQAGSSRALDVPLVAHRDGLLRLFLKTDSFSVAMPRATVTLLDRDGKPLYSTALASEAAEVPSKIHEGRLERSLNTILDGTHLVPGVRLVVDVDPTSDPAMTRRIEMPLDVREMPDLNVTLVPVIYQGKDSSAIGRVEEIVADPGSSEVLTHTLYALPVMGYEFSAHEPIVLGSDDLSELGPLLSQLELIWRTEGGTGQHYMGLIPSPLSGRLAGAALLGGWTSFAVPRSDVIAHELGHNLSLAHAPCGDAPSPDPRFPDPLGRVGVWGFDFADRSLVAPDHPDVMGYCTFLRPWISDYHFRRALRHRSSAQPQRTAERQHRRDVLVVWGWIDPDGSPFLEPAFYTEGIPTRFSSGSHQLTGRDAAGEALFSYGFNPGEVADGPGGAPFVHMIPVTWERRGALASIALDGLVGLSARLDRNTDQPLSIIIRDGQIRSIVRDSVAPQPGPERVIFSRGIPRR